MIEPFVSMFLSPTKAFRRFSVLLAIYHSPEVSQQQIGKRTHLSSSMVNNYIKQLKKEGHVCVHGTNNRNQSYYLTASGHRELVESLVQYSGEVIRLYANAKQEFAKLLGGFYREGIRTAVLFGAAETAEVVYAAMKRTPIRVTGIVDSDPGKQGQAFDRHIIKPPSSLIHLSPDAVIVTSFGQQEEICQTIKALVGDSIPIKRLSMIGAEEETN
ncbi:MarR family winged helix-turn-helix transcriptional regulator [Desulfosarcina alkanivorans]|nr:MarR family winged helix-turn-helix transcriptional regulator [Desulfosarcina alkanivorans]